MSTDVVIDLSHVVGMEVYVTPVDVGITTATPLKVRWVHSFDEIVAEHRRKARNQRRRERYAERKAQS